MLRPAPVPLSPERGRRVRSSCAVVIAFATVLALEAGAAGAEPVATTPAPAAAPEEETRLPLRAPTKPLAAQDEPAARPPYSHKDQVGLALFPGSGYRMIVPYKDAYCGQLGNRVCSGRIPWFLDVEPSYGLSDGWDLVVTLRFGLERDFHLHRTFAAMPGFRYWVDRDMPLRLFTTLQLVYDDTDQNGNVATDGTAISDMDLGFRNANGFMYDVLRNFSLYFQFGETIAFKRWFRFEMDGGFGIQARVP